MVESQVRVLRAIARLNVGGPAWNAVLLTARTRARYPTLLAVGSTAPNEADMSALAARHGVSPVRVPGLGREIRVLGDLRALWCLWRLCVRHRPSIVHTHTAKAGMLGRIAAWLAGVPVRVHTYHGHVFRGYFGRFETALYIVLERLLARITTRIIAISPLQAEELRGYLKVRPEKIRVVQLGLDLGRFAKVDETRARTRFREKVGAGDRVVVTMVGRLTGIKNHALALQAIARMGAAASDILLVLVGGGENEGELRALAANLGLADRVNFAGWWEDLEAVYFGSDIVALTSDNEGTPVCLIEALACGRPVIATEVGGVADVLEQGRFGVLVPMGDVAALETGLRRLLNPSERTRFAGVGRSAVLARYDVTRLVKDVEQLYDDLLGNSAVAPHARSMVTR